MGKQGGPSIADRYLRSIGLAVGAVMVGVVAYPIIAVLVGLGASLQATWETSDSFGGGLSDGAVVCFVAAGVLAAVAVGGVFTLAWLSLVALSRAGLEFKLAEKMATWDGERGTKPASASRRRATSSGYVPIPVPANPVPGPDAPQGRVFILSESEMAHLDRIVPASLEPGWYVDPLGKAGGRWWNGQGWTGRVQGAPPPS